MPTNFTVVPVEARADGGQDEGPEQTEAPGPPEGGEPNCPSPGEGGRTCPRDKGGGRAARVWRPGGRRGEGRGGRIGRRGRPWREGVGGRGGGGGTGGREGRATRAGTSPEEGVWGCSPLLLPLIPGRRLPLTPH